MSFVCTLSNDPCAAIHVLHLSRWILVRLVGHFCSRTRSYPRDYNMSITCGLVWLLLETCCQPNGLTHQCGLFAPSVDSRPCSSTQWLLDVANPLVARLHHLNLVRWSCDSIAWSMWLSTSSSVWFSTAFSSSFCWFSSANWSHKHQLLFDTTPQLGNYPSPSSWWRCAALISSLISVCRAKASSCSLPLTLSGKVLIITQTCTIDCNTKSLSSTVRHNSWHALSNLEVLDNSWHTVTALWIGCIPFNSSQELISIHSKHHHTLGMIALTPFLIKYLALQQLKLILAECTHSCRMSASSWSFLARLLSLKRTNSNNLLPRHATLRSVLRLVCAYTVHICLLLSLWSFTLQSPTAALIRRQLLDATSRSSCYSSSTKWHDAPTARDSSHPPLVEGNDGLCSLFLCSLCWTVSFLPALSASLCGSLQRRVRGLLSGTSDTTVWLSVRGKCSFFAVEVFYNNAFCCLSPVSHSLLPFTCSVDCFSLSRARGRPHVSEFCRATSAKRGIPTCAECFWCFSVFSACLLHVWACMKALWTLRFCIQVLLSRDPSTSSGPHCGFTCIFWILCTCLSTVHPSLRSRRSPCQSTDSCTLRIVDTCRCDSTMFPSTRTWHWDLFCFLHHLCVARLPAHQRSCPVYSCIETSTVCGAFWLFNVDVMHLCVGDFWHAFETVSLVKRSAICFLSLSNSSKEFNTPYSLVLMQTLWNVLLQALLSVDDFQHFDTLLQNLLYRVLRSVLGIDVLAEYAGSPHQFSSKSAELARQLSAPRYSARISSMWVTRFLFPPSQNPSDVAFKLLTMLTFLNTVSFLIVSPSNFAISSSRSSLHTLTSTHHEASSLLSTPSLGTLRFSSPHSLAPQASSLLLYVTPIRHFVHVVRSLTMPWQSQRLPERLSSSVSVSLCRTLALRIWTLTSVLHPTPHCHHQCTYNLNCWHLSHAELLTWIIQCSLELMVWCPSPRQWIASGALWQSSFASSITRRCCRRRRSDLVSSVTPRRCDLVLVSHVSHDETQVLVLHWLGIGNGSLDWRCLCAFTWLTLLDVRILTLHNLLDMADLAASSFFTGILI